MGIYAIGIYLVWITFSFLEGVREAYSGHSISYIKFSKEDRNEWIIYLERVIFFIVMGYLLYTLIGPNYLIVSLLGMVPIFYYVQNGTYFLIRNKLNPNVFKLKQLSDCEIGSEGPVMYLKNKLRNRILILGILSQVFWFV